MKAPALTRTLLLALVSVGIVFVLVEIMLRVVAPFPNPYGDPGRLGVNQYIRFEYPRHYAAVTEAEAGLPGLSGRNRFTTNNMGFRGGELVRPRPAGEFRVFLVGGSTFECFYLDDHVEIGRVVQNELPPLSDGRAAKVYNVGLSGAASDDHLAMIGQRLVHLEPDLIVVFAGINDLTRSNFDFDYLHYVDTRLVRERPWHKRFAMNFQITRRLHRLKTRMAPDARTLQESRPLVTNYAGRVGLQRTGVGPATPPRTDEASYARNLRSIAGIARANGFGLVFMTQPSTWNSTVDAQAREWSWMRYRDGVTYGEAEMDAALERLNDTLRAVAGENGVPVCDLVAVLPKSLQYFYDDCHFTPAGAAEAGKHLAGCIVGCCFGASHHDSSVSTPTHREP
ncbi:MAG TPA: SGNH/GDSL hydrolase family protein [Candidatus Krumholzibacteria bacterium]|nr:SGNH/GDSL hydrolase family protein [Candidatus Krumholzibacteria bacterium]